MKIPNKRNGFSLFFPFSLPHSLFSLSITAFQSLDGVDKRRRQPGFSSESTLAGWDVTKIAATVWVAVSPPLPSHSLVFLPSAESVGAESPEAPTMVPCQPAPRAVPSAGDRPLQAGTTLYAKMPRYPCFRRCQHIIPNVKTREK